MMLMQQLFQKAQEAAAAGGAGLPPIAVDPQVQLWALPQQRLGDCVLQVKVTIISVLTR